MFKMFSRIFGLTSAAGLAVVLTAACVHGSDRDERKEDYQESAEDRIEEMRDNIEGLEERAQELLGSPRDELAAAIDSLRANVDRAAAELKELRDREVSTWVQKKQVVDQQLSRMDQAYDRALETLQAH